MNDFEHDLRERLQGARLPVAPDGLARALDSIVATPVPRRRGGRRPIALLAVAAVLAGSGMLIVAGGGRLSLPNLLLPNAVVSDEASSPPATSPVWTASFPAEVDGHDVHSVSELLAARAAGQLSGGPIALAGYWSYLLVGHSCGAPQGDPGELEIYCHDGEFGITERNEPSAILTRESLLLRAEGPMVTPWVSETLLRTIVLAPVNGQMFPPVPILVLGHFDDPRAAQCRPAARALCEDRFVIDELVDFDVAAVATPGVSPTPTAFPFDAPPAARFEASQCLPPGWDQTPEFSFVGWKSGQELDLTSQRDFSAETLYVAIAKDIGPLGDWFMLPGDDRESRSMGRLVCLSGEWEPPGGAVYYDSVAGTTFRVYRDGSTFKASP